MAIIQDKNKQTPVLSIKIGGRFHAQKETKGNLYPPERLLNFLTVNPNDKAEIIAFCNNYRFIPRDMRHGLIFGFRKEHKEIREMANKLVRGQATKKDLEKIDSVLNTIKDKYDYVSSNQILEINSSLGKRDNVPTHLIRQKYLLKLRKQTGTIVSLWEDMVNQIILDQNIKTCTECGTFFWVTKQVKIHKYCSDECRDKRNHRLRYKKKLKS